MIKFFQGFVLLIIVMAILVASPFLTTNYGVTVLFLFFTYLTLSQAWNLLGGYSGLISLGQPAFVGLGAYTFALLTIGGMPLYVGIISGGLVAAFFALIISVPTLRMKGIFFAIGTWVVAEALRIWMVSWEVVGGGAGMVIRAARDITPTGLFYVSLVLASACLLTIGFILKSRLGLALMAIRDNENAAATCGVNVYRCKLFSFLISAFITGVAAGVLYTFQVYLEPFSAFSQSWTVLIMTSVIIGGIGTIGGPFIGTGIVLVLQLLIARFIGVNLLIQGIILIGVIALAPRGIMGTINKSKYYRSLLKIASKK